MTTALAEELMAAIKRVTTLQLRYLEIQRQVQDAAKVDDIIKVLDGLAAMAEAAETLAAELQKTARSSYKTVAALAVAELTPKSKGLPS